jgi:hypothetical protein
MKNIFSLFGYNKQPRVKIQMETPVNHVTAQLNHILMPIDRGDRYEDPLREALSAQGLGDTSGGGTMQKKSGEIDFINVEIELTNFESGVPFVISKLEELGAPKGSILLVHDINSTRKIPFGKTEGIGIYLDGVKLPSEVYGKTDVNVVIEELNKRIKGHGEMHSHWRGNTETGLYFYGDDANRMISLMSDFIDTYPLCKGARVVTIAPIQTKD